MWNSNNNSHIQSCWKICSIPKSQSFWLSMPCIWPSLLAIRENERDWDKDLAEDVKGECESKYGLIYDETIWAEINVYVWHAKKRPNSESIIFIVDRDAIDAHTPGFHFCPCSDASPHSPSNVVDAATTLPPPLWKQLAISMAVNRVDTSDPSHIFLVLTFNVFSKSIYYYRPYKHSFRVN